jgi:hypothetical protein
MKQLLVVGSEPVSHFGLVGLLKEFNDLMIPVLVLVARGKKHVKIPSANRVPSFGKPKLRG